MWTSNKIESEATERKKKTAVVVLKSKPIRMRKRTPGHLLIVGCQALLSPNNLQLTYLGLYMLSKQTVGVISQLLGSLIAPLCTPLSVLNWPTPTIEHCVQKLGHSSSPTDIQMAEKAAK